MNELDRTACPGPPRLALIAHSDSIASTAPRPRGAPRDWRARCGPTRADGQHILHGGAWRATSRPCVLRRHEGRGSHGDTSLGYGAWTTWNERERGGARIHPCRYGEGGGPRGGLP